MTIRQPIILDPIQRSHAPLVAGDTFAGSAIQLSSDAGNAVQLGADGGLFASAAKPGRFAMTITGKDLSQTDWVSAGSPSSWNIGSLQLAVPDALLNVVCLLFLHVCVSPIQASAVTYYDTSGPTGVPQIPLFMMTGSGAGRLTVKPDANIAPPSWGIYLVNSDRAALPAGSTISVGRTLNGVNYTGTGGTVGIIRVYERLTLVPLS